MQMVCEGIKEDFSLSRRRRVRVAVAEIVRNYSGWDDRKMRNGRDLIVW